jgi:hypothetical protein
MLHRCRDNGINAPLMLFEVSTSDGAGGTSGSSGTERTSGTSCPALRTKRFSV